MALKTTTDYIIAIPVQKSLQLGQKAQQLYSLKEATGAQLKLLIEDGSPDLEKAVILEVKRKFSIKPRTVFDLCEAQPKQQPDVDAN